MPTSMHKRRPFESSPEGALMSCARGTRRRCRHRSARTTWRQTMAPVSSRALLCYVAAIFCRSVRGTIGTYYASNCYEVGGGNMGPLYLECTGCQYTEAFECLQTLRGNTSHNVPSGCGMNILTVQPDPTCCPVFEDPDNQRSLDSSTSAYPDALLCLENAGCEGDNLHTNLKEECVFNLCNEEFACVAAYSGSWRLSPAVGTAVVLALAVARIPTSLGFGPGG
ncbi:unnamed protein product [Ectocarpus fasciculatus]